MVIFGLLSLKLRDGGLKLRDGGFHDELHHRRFREKFASTQLSCFHNLAL
jgi:hypothetical protein